MPSILLSEVWESDADLQTHICSELYRRVLAAIELASEAPDVCFHQVVSTEGMALIERLRGTDEASEGIEPITQPSR